jgi:hypothetical protein
VKPEEHAHVPLDTQVPLDVQGLGHEEYCKVSILSDEAFENGELGDNCVKSLMDSHAISGTGEESVLNATHRPSIINREFTGWLFCD